MNSCRIEENAKIVAKVTWAGAAVNIMLSALKLATGFFAGSQALIADGFHSLSDLITDGAVLIGTRYWGAGYDEKHPYGHQRIETMVSFIIALMLAAVGAAIAWQAVVTIQEEDSTRPGLTAFFAAALSIIVKELLYRWTIKKGKEADSKALISNAWHHRSDALSSVPVAAAVIGGLVLPQLTMLDHIAAIIVSVMLMKAAWDIAVPCIQEVMDTQADKELDARLNEIKKEKTEIKEFHKIRSRISGSSIFVDLHMLVNPEMTVADAHDLTRYVEKRLKEQNRRIIDVTIHVEPC